MSRFECPKCPKELNTDNRHNRSLGKYKVFVMGNYLGLKCQRCGHVTLIKRMNHFVNKLKELIQADKNLTDAHKTQINDIIKRCQDDKAYE